MQTTGNREQVVEHADSTLDAETDATAHEGCFIHDAWKTSEALLSLGDKNQDMEGD